MKLNRLFIASVIVLSSNSVIASQPVSQDNYVRAVSDSMLQSQLQAIGNLGDIYHFRTPLALDNQPIIRMNLDTLYSGVILDLSEPAHITLPEGGERYISMQVTNQDHYIYAETQAGVYTLTQENVGTRYASLSFRTLMNASAPADIIQANKLQDKILIDTPINGSELELPNWDKKQLYDVGAAINELAKMGFHTTYAFGLEHEVEAIQHLIRAAAGWDGLPAKNATYFLNQVENTTESAYSLTVKDVPVDAFWSITVYNKAHFLEENTLGINSYNSSNATANKDGSFTINFSDCEKPLLNCIPTTEGWSYVVRMYEPQEPILSGKWQFPIPQPVKS